MKRPWIYSINPFETATSNSYAKALKISTYHYDALAGVQTDPFFGPLYNTFAPLHTTLRTNFSNYTAQQGAQMSKTLSVNQFLDLLSNTKVKQWDISTQGVHPQGTPAYKNLFPHFRVPFQQGTQLERINAVKTLSLALTGDTALATTKTDVDNFYAQLDAANNTQKSSKSATASNSDKVETARINVCIAMYANLGAMIQKFASTPEVIADYFDLASIRSGSQVDFTGHLKPLHSHNVCKHTFSTEDIITVKNTSPVALQLFLGLTKTTEAKIVLPSGIVTIAANSEQAIPASSLGDLTHTNLIIYNPDANITAEWEVVL